VAAAEMYQNGWSDYGGSYARVAYTMDSVGIVHLKGMMKGGTCGAVAFSLPARYCPTDAIRQAVGMTGTALPSAAIIYITPSGTGSCDISVYSGTCNNAWVSLEGITIVQ
jgi:hypothetical protein